MSKLRFRVVETAFKKKAVEVATPAERPSEYFGKYVFNKEKMFKYLPSTVFARLIDAMDNGAALDRGQEVCKLGVGRALDFRNLVHRIDMEGACLRGDFRALQVNERGDFGHIHFFGLCAACAERHGGKDEGKKYGNNSSHGLFSFRFAKYKSKATAA